MGAIFSVSWLCIRSHPRPLLPSHHTQTPISWQEFLDARPSFPPIDATIFTQAPIPAIHAPIDTQAPVSPTVQTREGEGQAEAVTLETIDIQDPVEIEYSTTLFEYIYKNHDLVCFLNVNLHS
jgi:hypothetical protein